MLNSVAKWAGEEIADHPNPSTGNQNNFSQKSVFIFTTVYKSNRTKKFSFTLNFIPHLFASSNKYNLQTNIALEVNRLKKGVPSSNSPKIT